MSGAAAEPPALAPLRHRVFAVLWGATLVGNVGVWMRDSTSAWVMTTLTNDPTLIALVQSAATLPIFALAIPAGALADIVDRRRMMIGVQAGLAGVSLVLTIMILTGSANPAWILALTALGGVGAALGAPAWQSIVPELVPRSELRAGVALNSLGVNISRAIGPAAGGALLAGAGAASAYSATAFAFLAATAALVWWPRHSTPDPHRALLGSAIAAGLRYAIRAPALQRLTLRAALFFLFGSAYWALLPLVAKLRLGGEAGDYGLMLAAIGVGAIVGALLLPRVRGRMGAEALVTGGTIATGLTTALLAWVSTLPQALAILALAGMAWITVLSSINAAVQMALPDWVRARGLALYLTAFFGALTVGSFAWGQLATGAGIETTLLVAGGGNMVVALLATRLALPNGAPDLSAAHPWPDPGSQDAGDGPALILVEYRVAAEDCADFAIAAEALGRIRRRDGAISWGLTADVEQVDVMVEWFVTPSWAEHLRQHDRFTHADLPVQAAVRAFHHGGAPPRVRHLVPPALKNCSA